MDLLERRIKPDTYVSHLYFKVVISFKRCSQGMSLHRALHSLPQLPDSFGVGWRMINSYINMHIESNIWSGSFTKPLVVAEHEFNYSHSNTSRVGSFPGDFVVLQHEHRVSWRLNSALKLRLTLASQPLVSCCSQISTLEIRSVMLILDKLSLRWFSCWFSFCFCSAFTRNYVSVRYFIQ